MFENQKSAFWQALLVTILIFGIGVLAGILIENMRTSQISNLYQISEVELLDIRLQNELYSGNFDCQTAVDENFKFADKVYQEAQTLERYEKASRLTQNIVFQHKKYDILRAMLFMNSLEIRRNCNVSYHEVLYFYKFNNPRLDLKAKQDVFSRLLGEIKQDSGRGVLLIPMAADNELSSINIILRTYNISVDELPVVLIDGSIKITELEKKEDLSKFLK